MIHCSTILSGSLVAGCGLSIDTAELSLMLLMPFTKFAHVIYRPVALFFYAMAAAQSKSVGAPR